MEQAPQNSPPPAAPPDRPWARRLSYVIVIFCLTVLAAALYARWAVWEWSKDPFGEERLARLVILPRTSLAELCDQLQREGIVGNAHAFRAYAFLVGKQAGLQAGEYQIQLPIRPNKLLQTLLRGSFQRRATIPEGWTARQIDARLLEEGLIDRAGAWTEAVAEPIGEEVFGEAIAAGAEGFCFPDTYQIDPGTPAGKIREKSLKKFAQVWAELDPSRRDPRSEKLSAFEVVTLASIIEREARRPEEQSMMASVFLNRLKKKMKLQSCASVYHATGKPPAEPLAFRDLEADSPYNTYRNAGLPLGPIGNPGRGAIEAVLRPAPNDFLYFVHRGDGTHEFTKTYKEHLAAARKFRKADPNAGLLKEQP